MRRFLIIFAIVAVVGHLLTTFDFVQQYVSSNLNLAVSYLSGGLVKLLGGEVNISGEFLTKPGVALRVVDMCNGIEAAVLLWSAFLAYPSPWPYRLRGMLIGLGVIEVVNVIRICTLFFLADYNEVWFDWAHRYLFDTIMIVTIVVYFLLWLWRIPVDASSDGANATA